MPEHLAEQRARPPWLPARWQLPAGDNPTKWVPDLEPYDAVPRGSLPLLSELLRSWDPSPMNIDNYMAATLALTTRLPLAFGWLVGDAEAAMGIILGALSQKWGEISCRSGGLCPGDTTQRLIAPWMTWRQSPVPSWLRPMAEGANQPFVPSPRRGTYGNAAVARAAPSVPAPAWFSSSSSSSGPGATIRAQQRPGDTTRTRRAATPSRADVPKSCQQHCAAKRAAGDYLPTPQRHIDATSTPPEGAPTANHGNPAPAVEGGSIPQWTATDIDPATDARPEEPLRTTRPQPTTNLKPTRNLTPQAPTSAHGHHYRTPTQAQPERYPNLGSPAQLTAAVPPDRPPTPG